MKNKLIYPASLMVLLFVSMVSVSALDSYSLRGSGGDIVQINGITDFRYEKASLNAYISGSTGTGQGSVLLQAVTNGGERLRLGVKLVDSRVLRDDNFLVVVSNGYYFERVRMYGMWTVQKIEGKVTYVFNKNTGKTTVWGTNGLNFRVLDLETVNLK